MKLNELRGVVLVLEGIDGNSNSTTTSSSSGHKLSMDETSLYKYIVAISPCLRPRLLMVAVTLFAEDEAEEVGIYKCICAYVSVCLFVCICVRMCIMYMQVYVSMYAHVCVYMCICVFVCASF